ncbi:MAG: cache domain-containing protein, partial [Bradyrhizobium sp.]|nr:cache domain-containing protein [Bradyrhizobium sp.]
MRQLIASIRGKTSQVTAAALRRLAVGRGRDPITWLIICGCALVVAITLGTVMMADEFRERAMANSERELGNSVLLMTRHFDQQFEDAEIIANDVIAQIRTSEMASPQEFRAKMSTVEAHQMLKSAISVLSYVGDVTIFDADGQLI